MRIRVEQGITGVAPETIDMPSVAGWKYKNQQGGLNKESIPTYLIQRPFPPRESVKNKDAVSTGTRRARIRRIKHTSPQPLQGYGMSSWSIGDSGLAAGDSISGYSNRSQGCSRQAIVLCVLLLRPTLKHRAIVGGRAWKDGLDEE
jgi:hypothetical protein